jgi:hypothetical protein
LNRERLNQFKIREFLPTQQCNNSTILRIQFTRRAMAGGVQGYIAFLRGRRVMYWGRNGEQHVEWFPGAKP